MCADSYFINVLPMTTTWDASLSQQIGVVGEWELLGVDIMAADDKLNGVYVTIFSMHLRRKYLFYQVSQGHR
jgi:hypothetical protein